MKSGHEEWDDVCTDALHVGLSVSADNELHDLECATEQRRTGVSSRINKVAALLAMEKKKGKKEKQTSLGADILLLLGLGTDKIFNRGYSYNNVRQFRSLEIGKTWDGWDEF
jgi:hypothetical protein